MGAGMCREESKVPEPADPEAAENHRRIEMGIKMDAMEERKIVKVLLLGPADSGKSTIAKQMRILHTDGFNEGELINYRYMIHTNVIMCYHHIAIGIHQLGIPIADASEKELVEKFSSDSFRDFLDYDDEDQIKVIQNIAACASVKEACLRMNEFYVPDNTTYLFSQTPRILDAQYKPTEVDVIHARASTTGVHEIMFAFRRFNIRLIDVGGQKTERRKWIHCFDSVTAILFVASLYSYDQYMEEDPEKNRMEDSVELFEKMFANEFLLRASIILFLNKKDLFEDKLEHVELRKFFPKFADKNEYEPALAFLTELFLRCQKDTESARQIYTHVTNATDQKNIGFVFGAACDIILSNNLNRAGMS